MNEVFGRAFTVALMVAMGLLVAYQFAMLWWTKKTVGSIPPVIKWLRAINITLILAGIGLIAYKLAGR